MWALGSGSVTAAARQTGHQQHEQEDHDKEDEDSEGPHLQRAGGGETLQFGPELL